uniref:Uncharacterized protein n=1 Tax=Zooxanthella nutricula TaxID=1333877 RepID=A0A6U8XR64_9DINO|mmetsp:Transcript_92903/g.284378  ORF Transcript_92903/g.284378 Transcript_92903/m.284378 type:complete len:114 (+) Transcript_92903:83-424(+)|eukprot:CAMPEP_0198540774 /NCGR_PEP_ID=MMETSP1462-20131121/53386_1 /TAXON_ID=1333877 /ORGANISM="Brandtodinium nutriculum, Strain RCC3387" /LENGTH=113 /DNA_ID=CAMNT_0044270901 /DNA_START=82 /DNA_END=423 /DNA_ORIENTATION=-
MAFHQRRPTGTRSAAALALGLAAIAVVQTLVGPAAGFVPAPGSQEVAQQIVPHRIAPAVSAPFAAAATVLVSEPALATDYDDRTASASLVLVGLCALAAAILGGIWIASTSGK